MFTLESEHYGGVNYCRIEGGMPAFLSPNLCFMILPSINKLAAPFFACSTSEGSCSLDATFLMFFSGSRI